MMVDAVSLPAAKRAHAALRYIIADMCSIPRQRQISSRQFSAKNRCDYRVRLWIHSSRICWFSELRLTKAIPIPIDG
jgi:hypothetical protein